MTDRDWGRRDAKDRRATRVDAHAGRHAGAFPGAGELAAQASSRDETSTGVMARLGLACALGIGIIFWPYGARCGINLAGYLGAVAMLVTAGVWSAVWTGSTAPYRCMLFPLLLLLTSIVLAAMDVLPRVGYAKPSVNHPANWTCS